MTASVQPWRDAVRMRAPNRLALFAPRAAVTKSVFAALLSAIALAPSYWDETLWIGAGIALAVFVGSHGMVATKRVPWMPGFVVGVACVQWILAPWAAYHLPPVPTAVPLVLDPAEYFSYAVPATYALAIGLFLPLRRLGRYGPPRVLGNIDRRRLRRTLDAMLLVGLFARMVLMPFAPAAFRLPVLLVSEFAWVGGFGAMLIEAPGWRIRIIALLAVEAILGAAQGMFAELVLWSIYLALLYLFARRVRRVKIILLAAAAVVSVFTLNGIKASFREEIYGSNLSALARGALAADYFTSMLRDPSKLVAEDNISYNVTRLDQGSIIGRVMYWTPSREPFAEGETVLTALYASLVPRFLVPDKYVAGGGVNYPRFTGLQLVGSTSINLSLAGELYANFGRRGGILAMLIIGWIFGNLFAVFVRWSRHSILWWAWLPYVMLSVVSAEGGLGETLNQIVKSGIVMLALILIVPAWETLRLQVSRRRRPTHAAPVARAG